MSDIILPHNHSDNILTGLDTPTTEDFMTVAEIFKQLGDASRIRIFWILCHCEECVTNISVLVNMSSPAVSHHLRLLKSGGLVIGTRKGKEVYYRAADTCQAQLLHGMIEKMVTISCPQGPDREG